MINLKYKLKLNSNIELFPLVLESIAFGKKPIILDNNCYEGYFPNNLALRVKCDKVSRLFTDDTVDLYDESKYYLVSRPRLESLRKSLHYAYNNKDSIKINDDNVNKFIDKYNWLNIAENLSALIKDMQP